LILPVDFSLLLEQGDLTQNMALNDRDVVIIPRSPIANWNQWMADATATLNFLLLPVSTPASIHDSIQTLNSTLAAP